MTPKNSTTEIWKAMSFDKNTVVEASAGTGKTYALEKIVVELVSVKKIPLENILLVTYTEKAAGELRNRIRSALNTENIVADFDAASISTIHSFCQRMSREYAFENGRRIAEATLGDDIALAQTAVREILRTDTFKQKYGVCLPTALGALATDSMEEFVRRMAAVVVKSCGGLTDECGVLPPTNATKSIEPLKQAAQSVKSCISNLDKAEQTDVNQKRRESIRILMQALTEQRDDDEIAVVLAQNNKAANKRSPLDLRLDNKKWLTDICPEYGTFTNLVSDFAQSVTVEAAKTLKSVLCDCVRHFREFKAKNDIISYDDIVRNFADLLDDPKSGGALTATLRKRYRIALVDEFQDTDETQWKIFRTIFDNPPHNSICVVGDPKQAIYAFRGADVQTYFKAKRHILENGGQSFSLDCSYRSSKPLLEAFNSMFLSHLWFQKPDPDDSHMGITYRNVNFPEKPKEEIASVHGRQIPIALLECTNNDWTRKKNINLCPRSFCEKNFANAAVRELQKLADVAKKQNLELDYGNFCFLVRQFSDAQLIKNELTAAGIPFLFYKETGIYSSEEAEALIAIFDFLATPDNDGAMRAALLTPFFRIPVRQVLKHPGLTDPVFADLVWKWQFLAENHEWGKLFDSLVYDSKLWIRRSEDNLYFRRFAAVRQILDALLLETTSIPVSVEYFAQKLRNWRKNDTSPDETASLRRKSSEDSRVSIMTMHASKGLEFPVVFFAHGFSAVKRSKSNPDSYEKLLLDKNDAQTSKQAAEDDELEEVKRLFYVAITRAKFRVYFPWTRCADNDMSFRLGSKHAALARLSANSDTTDDEQNCAFLGVAIDSLVTSGQAAFADPDAFDEADEILVARLSRHKPDGKNASSAQVEIPRLPPLHDKVLRYDSFSSLRTHNTVDHSGIDRLQIASDTRISSVKTDDDHDDTAATEEEPENTLPSRSPSLVASGTNMGTTFHQIMQTLCEGNDSTDSPGFAIAQHDDFRRAYDESLAQIVIDAMTRNNVPNRVDPVTGDTSHLAVARMVWNALRTKIHAAGKTFRLADIPKSDRRAEVNFAISETMALNDASAPQAGVLNGSIDLLFRIQDEYFIVDWKTNRLEDENYSDSAVAAKMKYENYHLQRHIYSLAVSKYLGGIKKSAKVAAEIYLFVRGGEREIGLSPGIFTDTPGDIGEIQRDLCRIIREEAKIVGK